MRCTRSTAVSAPDAPCNHNQRHHRCRRSRQPDRTAAVKKSYTTAIANSRALRHSHVIIDELGLLARAAIALETASAGDFLVIAAPLERVNGMPDRGGGDPPRSAALSAPGVVTFVAPGTLTPCRRGLGRQSAPGTRPNPRRPRPGVSGSACCSPLSFAPALPRRRAVVGCKSPRCQTGTQEDWPAPSRSWPPTRRCLF